MMVEEYRKEEEQVNDKLIGFLCNLSEVTGERLPIGYSRGTYEIEGDTFTLTFTINNGFFEIRSVNVRGNTGLGSQIVTVVHNYADENGLEVIASNVLDTAQGFWEKMGYQEGETEGEYFRVA